MNTSTETLITALRLISRDIKSEDGVVNTAIAEGADRIEELHDECVLLRQKEEVLERENAALREDKARLYGFLRNFQKLDRHGIDAAREAKP